jgi:K+-sensing histidine kinase KdpD
MPFRWPEFQVGFLPHSLSRFRHKPARFFLATAFVLAAVAITAMATFLFRSTAGLIFALAIAASTALFGLVAGLCTAAATVLALDFFYIPPSLAFNMDSSTLRIAIAMSAISLSTHLIERHPKTAGTAFREAIAANYR